MYLTDKCKQDFEKWYVKTPFYLHTIYSMDWFYSLPQSMQYGVLVYFFDSVDINVHSSSDYWSVDGYDGFANVDFDGTSKTRQEAREQAIIKANQIYNETKRN